MEEVNSLRSKPEISTQESETQIAKMSEVHNFSGPELDNLKILHEGTTNKEILKTFREIRTQAYEKAEGKNFTCLVTSVCPQGGASYISSNLAAAIALDKSRSSLLVDANFYAPNLDNLLSAKPNLGLTDYLSVQEMGIEFILYASGIKRLRVIPAGKNAKGATEKLSSSKMRSFFRELKARYPDRYIIVDAPSAGEFSADIRLMADHCDFVILVVPYGKVSETQVNQCVEAIGENRLAGLVFNNV